MCGVTRVDLRVRRFNLHITSGRKTCGLNRVGPRVPRLNLRSTSGLLSAGSGCDLTRVCFKSHIRGLTRFRFMSLARGLTRFRFNLRAHSLAQSTRIRFMSHITSGLFPLSVGTPLLFFLCSSSSELELSVCGGGNLGHGRDVG